MEAFAGRPAGLEGVLVLNGSGRTRTWREKELGHVFAELDLEQELQMGKVRIGTEGMEEWSRHVGALVKL